MTKHELKPSVILSLILSVVLALVVLSASIAAPILIRPFYYAHIGPLRLAEHTGITEDEIRTAYDEMLDYCLGAEEFSTGVLAWSESGKSHFTDVRELFLMDIRIMILSAGMAALIPIFCDVFLKLRPARLAGRGPCFWAGAGLGGAFLIIGGLAALDFDRAFVVFHSLFFPGKTNWIFDPWTDQIINILPEVFFMDCAILILVLLILGCAALIAADCFLARSRT